MTLSYLISKIGQRILSTEVHCLVRSKKVYLEMKSDKEKCLWNRGKTSGGKCVEIYGETLITIDGWLVTFVLTIVEILSSSSWILWTVFKSCCSCLLWRASWKKILRHVMTFSYIQNGLSNFRNTKQQIKNCIHLHLLTSSCPLIVLVVLDLPPHLPRP